MRFYWLYDERPIYWPRIGLSAFIDTYPTRRVVIEIAAWRRLFRLDTGEKL